MTFSLEIQIADRSPGSAGFSMEAQKATEFFLCRGNTAEAVESLIGTTRKGGDGRLERHPPKRHPRWGNLYVASVDVTGMGQNDPHEDGREAELVDADDTLEIEPATDQWHNYAIDLLRVEFMSRPYAVLSDASIPTPAIENYYDFTNTLINTKVVAQEWLRYTELSYEPNPELAYSQHGQLRFYAGNTAPPHLFTFSGFPRMTIPKAAVGLTWTQVPMDYLLSRNSTLVEFVGCVNQNDWFGWIPGELLYLGVKVIRRYTPPFPDAVVVDGGTAFSVSKLCDIVLNFEETVRTQTNLPTYGAGNTNTTIANRNYVIAGHNLMPFQGGRIETAPNTYVHAVRGFYYAGTANDHKTPVFLSAPFGRLFTDPDVA